MDVREQVKWFSEQMEVKLQQNDDKGGWDNCDIFWLIERLKEEVAELEDALYNHINFADRRWEVVREASDVGNFAMMVADVARKRLKD